MATRPEAPSAEVAANLNRLVAVSGTGYHYLVNLSYTLGVLYLPRYSSQV
jgi:hypothetical protein